MNSERLEVANQVLASFAPDSRITVERGKGVYVEWTANRSQQHYRRRWQAMHGQDFYPVWSRIWGHGGTATTALSQLNRWVKSHPVLPLPTWRMWASERCKLLPLEAVELLAKGGYPEQADCVLCGNIITGGLDWWHLYGVSGPCCSWTNGCRQKGKP